MMPNPLSGGDPHNRLFSENGRLYRGIAVDVALDVRRLFERGVVGEMMAAGHIPDTTIANIEIPGYAMVLEHALLPRVTYAHEWTFGMLQEAALFVLDFREFLAARGYDLVDAHCDNVVFHQGRPIWVDFGSIIAGPNPRIWAAERRFRQSFLYPLRIWSRLGEHIGRRVMLGGDYLPREAGLLATSWWARRLSPSMLRRLCTLLDNYAALAGAPTPVLERKLQQVRPFRALSGALPRVAQALLRRAQEGRLPGQRYRCAALRASVQHLRKRGYQTRWQDYHTGVLQEVAAFERYPRFRRVLELLKGFAPQSVTEIGTNQGALARLILQEVGPREMVCLDVDEGALEIFYRRNRADKETRITHAVLDAMRPFSVVPKLPPEFRFRSEALVALAVTHHMVLGQCNSVDHLFDRLAAFTTRWILVEYMPHGFHTEPVATPPPDTYSAARFDAAFRRHFEVLHIETLEPTRVLYVGRLLHPPSVT